MTRISKGEAWQLYITMSDEKPVAIYAKNPNRPIVQDITDELAVFFRDRAKTFFENEDR